MPTQLLFLTPALGFRFHILSKDVPDCFVRVCFTPQPPSPVSALFFLLMDSLPSSILYTVLVYPDYFPASPTELLWLQILSVLFIAAQPVLAPSRCSVSSCERNERGIYIHSEITFKNHAMYTVLYFAYTHTYIGKCVYIYIYELFPINLCRTGPYTFKNSAWYSILGYLILHN